MFYLILEPSPISHITCSLEDNSPHSQYKFLVPILGTRYKIHSQRIMVVALTCLVAPLKTSSKDSPLFPLTENNLRDEAAARGGGGIQGKLDN